MIKGWNPESNHGWVYDVVEKPNGSLVWVTRHNETWYGDDQGATFISMNVGQLNNREIRPDEAEAITGLHMPAAMDRLRELVHESGGGS